ncbi:MAG: MMPL family transporter [Solirubrobacterales bacterium]|nr:MMPL family transporter [Solirubrobacterales bacterium]
MTSVETSPQFGSIGRFGAYMSDHFRAVLVVWVLLIVVLGFFAPRVEDALSGAGWEASGSESVAARDVVDRDFGGFGGYGLMVVVASDTLNASAPQFEQTVASVTEQLNADPAVTTVAAPRTGVTISKDGKTAVVQAGAARDSNEMVRAADRLKEGIAATGSGDVNAYLTGAPGMWSDFNVANRDAMMKSELISWPVTLLILLFAFGSLVAAGLPLMLTIISLVAAAGSLYLVTKVSPVSIWAMNFALMFALALGIDYALFMVHRYRAALFGAGMTPRDATAATMDTAGKAVLFSGATVLISLSAVMLVPSPAFRSMSLGIMLAVLFILAATMTLLPAVLARLGSKVDKLALPWGQSGEHRSPTFAAWAERLWRHPWAFGGAAVAILVALALPVLNLNTAMPSIKVVPEGDQSRVGYEKVSNALGPGAAGTMQVVVPNSGAAQSSVVLKSDQGIAAVAPAGTSGGYTMYNAVPTADPSSPTIGPTIDRLRAELPTGALIGGVVAENHDLESALADKTWLVIGVVLALGFLLLLVALRAPLLAAAGVLTNLLAAGAAFGVAKLIFQDGALSGVLGFDPQGFLDAWGPVFFFAMMFAISMDYTVFLLSSAKEHWDRSHDPKEAMVGGVAHSGRVIFAAGAVMVAVFFTFAISGPLPPKEMGVILGIAVLLDTMLIRLLLMPVLLRVMGKWAWYLPRWAGAVLPDVRFGHGQ